MTQNEQEKPVANSSEYTVEELLDKTKAYLRYLKKHRLKTFLFGLVFALLGLAVAFKKKPKYTARMTFALHEESKAGGLSSLASQFGLGGGSAGSKELWSGFNIVPFLTSRLMVQKTLFTTAQFKDGPELLLNHYIKFYEYDKQWAKKKKLKNIKFTADTNLTRAQDSILGVFYHLISDKNLTLDRWDKKSSIVLLEFTDKDELFAKNFIEALVANATDYYISVKTKKAATSVRKLQSQADSIKRKLDIAMSSVAASADATPNPNPMKQTLKVSAQRKMIDVEMYSKSLIEITKSLELARIALTQDTPLINFLDKPILPLEVKKLSKPLALILGFIFGVGLSISILTFRKIAGKA